MTRLRLLGLLCEADLTVSELVAILGQSQPRVSRHLKLLVEAGLAERQREGAWAFYRLADRGGALARALIARVDPADPMHRRRSRPPRAGARSAAQARRRLFRRARRRLGHDPRAARARKPGRGGDPQALVGDKPLRGLLDLGTGTARMLELLAPLADRAVGVDQSPAMLAIARAHIDQSGLRNVQLRQGDIYAPPVERDAYDLVVIHQVLHFLDDPGRALAEAARALRPSGRLLVVDFAAHGEDYLRDDYAHRRLGFSNDEIAGFLAEAGPRSARRRACRARAPAKRAS